MVTEHSPFHFSRRPNHADAIPWQAWGPEVFARARAEDKPVLLSISAVWCHWCHVMDESTYSDAAVADLLTRHFVCVRVDADERPDVDARYNAGGWPTTAFLTSEGDVITAVTYLRADQMVDVLRRVHEGWLVNREGIAGDVEAGRVERQRRLLLGTVGGFLSPEMLDAALETLGAQYDEEHGGFRVGNEDPRAQLKFPNVAVLRLLLYVYRRRGDARALARARFTFAEMAASPLFDAVEGGFFRYATHPDWTEPHYEKLSREQGAMLLALGEFALIDEDAEDWAEPFVGQVIAYLAAVLGEPSGGFFGSQDADEAYYQKDDAGRTAHGAPAVDDRVYTAATALLARGLLQCGIAFRRRDWTERGLRAVDFLLTEMPAGEAGMYHAWDGAAYGLGQLADQTQTMLALLQAYEVTGRPNYLERARGLARVLEQEWRDPGRGFWDTADSHDLTGLLVERLKPVDENAEAAEAFLWLGRLTHDERFLRTAHETLGEFAGSVADLRVEDAGYARVADRMLSAEAEIKIVAETPPGEPDRVADPLHQAALRLPLAARTVQRLYLAGDGTLIEQLRLPPDRPRVAYVCVGSVCTAPLTDPDQLVHAIEDALSAPAY